jgi:hypothetical protein
VAAVATPGAARQDEGERAGPEGIDQLLRKRGHVAGKVGNACGVGHVHDQRVVAGAALGCKNLRHGSVAAGIGGQAVHGFGGQAQQRTAAQRRARRRRWPKDRCRQGSWSERVNAQQGSRLQRGGARLLRAWRR